MDSLRGSVSSRPAWVEYAAIADIAIAVALVVLLAIVAPGLLLFFGGLVLVACVASVILLLHVRS